MTVTTTGKRFLIVDDDPLMLEMLSDCLELAAKSCLLYEAKNGEQALIRLEEGKYDVLVTDYLMPGMSGVSLAQRARQIAPDLRIILVSSVSRSIISREIADLDNLCLITKPFDYEDILRAIAD
jgi:CheY-like chemotaxis protein